MGQGAQGANDTSSTRSGWSRPAAWGIGAVVVGAVIALAVLLAGGGDEPAAAPDWPDPMAVRTAQGGAPGASPRADDPRPRRPLEVAVTTCHGLPVEGAVVLSEAGGELLSATSDADGYARLRVLIGQAKVVARLATNEVTTVPTDAGTVEVDLCPGATLHGQVIDAWGEPQPGTRLALVDDVGEVLEESEADVDGGYTLTDLGLEAHGVLVDGEVRPLAPLTAREDRELDLLVGATRKVRGFVLDLSGDPVPGVFVTLRPMEFEGKGWSAVTDRGGGFAIVGPPSAGRVDADGGDLGMDRAWVGSGPEDKVVDLVLEPVGTITVVQPGAKDARAKVSVRCWDAKSMGEDQSWINGPPVPEMSPEEMQERYGEGPYPGSHYEEFRDGEAPPEPIAEPFQNEMIARVMKRFIAEMMPEVAIDGGDELSPDEFIQALQRKVEAMPKAEQEALEKRASAPDFQERMQRIVMEEMGMQPGDPALGQPAGDALPEANPADGELDPEPPEAAEPWTDDGVTDPEVAPFIEPEPGASLYAYEVPEAREPEVWDPGAAEGEGEGEVGPEWAGADVDELAPEAVPVIEPGYEPGDLDKYVTWVEGILGQALSVPANAWYDLFVERPDGSETPCGRVMVKPGEDLVVQCGGPDEASTVDARFVDRAGKPVGNLEVWWTANNVQDGDSYQEGRIATGADGRVHFELVHDKPSVVTLGIASTDDPWTNAYGRRNVVVVPGEEKDLGDLLWIAEGDRPESWPSAAYGGIGGIIELEDTGVTVIDMEEESPLALAGVEKQDTIVLIDGVPAAELPQDEVFLRLRGDPGTSVDLRLRSALGELYEVTVDRQMMAAPDETWGGGGDAAEVEPQDE